MHANEANVGDTVRSWDFKPMEGRGDCYVEGIVFKKDEGTYHIAVQNRVFDGKEVAPMPGEMVQTAFKTLFLEWAGRITKLEVA